MFNKRNASHRSQTAFFNYFFKVDVNVPHRQRILGERYLRTQSSISCLTIIDTFLELS